jgi:transposase
VARVNRSAVVVPDQTGWHVQGEGAWLWVVTTDGATAYNAASGRGFDEARDLLEEDFSGVIVRDGWGVYRCYTKATHQTCLAHLLRRCHEMATDNPDWAGATPREVRDVLTEALDACDLGADERQDVVADLSERIELLAEQPHPYEGNRRLINHLMNEREALSTFLTSDGVDATNYKAEQAIRSAVVNR